VTLPVEVAARARRVAIENALASLKEAIKTDDPDDIKAKTEASFKVANTLTH